MGEKKRRGAVAAGKTDASRARAHGARAHALAASSDFGPALEQIVIALELAPELDALWAQFGELVRFFNFRHPLDERVHRLLERALTHPAVDPGDLVRPISSAALSRGDENVFADTLLLRLMEDTLIRDARLEQLLTHTRRKALSGSAVPLEVLNAIAHQCFNTEYVFPESADEARAVHEPPADAELPQLALYAAYRPLKSLPDAGRIAERLRDTPLARLARQQIEEPAEEARLAAGIASLGGTANNVSVAVRAQYEENPYPRWRRLALIAPQEKASPSRVLIAGCGTGQHAIATARRMPRAKLLAIDLSLASLAYAKRKTLELGVPNIEYRQADLLSLPGEIGRFDHIEASGVLHHLGDPLAGWRSLTALLEPGATMRIGLYSERGRRAVVRARQLISEHGFEATPEGIRRCRAAIMARAEEDELLRMIVRNEDFYSMSGCRDLVFHVQEHRFELPQVEAMLGELGLRFEGFEFADSGMSMVRYKQRFAQDSLANWHLFEQDYPDTFSRMYQFWARRSG
jgi:ubiquinone/menaquinone biosynthesis C-methylase UbiE